MGRGGNARFLAIAIAGIFATTALAGCVSDAPGAEVRECASLPGECQEIVVGMPSGWTGEMVRSHMVAQILGDNLGYDVTVESLGAGPIYQGLAGGSVDVFVGAWLPLQAEHYAAVDDKVTILGDNLPGEAVGLYLAVPKYLADQGITSFEDLDANKEMFDATITGIESGAGMMISAKERMENWDIYGLGDWKVQDSSTGVMLAAYDAAVKNGDPIVVMMWEPHYAYVKWSGDQAMVNLEDPGYEVDGETRYFYKDQTEVARIQTLVPNAFADEHPVAAAFLRNFQVPGDDESAYMQDVNDLVDEGVKNPEKVVAEEYLAAHPELLASWIG